MKCRAIEKSGSKSNIVWFGSAGKNEGFQPVTFTEFDGNGNPMMDGKPWDVIKKAYWELSPFKYQEPKPSPSSLPFAPWDGSGYYLYGLTEKGIYIPASLFTIHNLDSFESFWACLFRKIQPIEPYTPNLKTIYVTGNKIPAENYNTGARGVRDSLIQRLSVIKGELWYKASYGLPLADKIKNKGIYDSIIVNIITSHPDVKTLISFSSSISKQTRKYEFSFTAMTIYSDEVSVKYAI